MCQINSKDKFASSNPAKKAEKLPIVWSFVIFWSYVHIAAFYGVYQFIYSPRIATLIWAYITKVISTQGSVVGAHRYWAHHAFKAKLPLQFYLAFCQTVSFQGSIHQWVRDHRTHHKFVDTNADPHNVNRGLFFAQLGWSMLKKHPDVGEKGKQVDLSDLTRDPIVMFQKKYFLLLGPVCTFLLPALVPWYFWGESFWLAWNFCGVFRYMLCIHFTGLINSYAHFYGMRPYDKYQQATESTFVAHLTDGDGWHNYHHAFPWDYKAAELDTYSGNLSLAFIHLMAKLGWAYDLRTVTPQMVENQCKKRGDQSRPVRFPHLLRNE